jgi:N-acyl-D-amino-acid deacylase
MQILRGATVIDGTGAAARPADVVVDGGRIVEVAEPGQASAAGATVIDLDGLVLSPGFIDVHTHYDAQILWDRDLTPSCWHGVTTVLIGNCGFGIAPTRPKDRSTIARTLENVEAMSMDALTAGIPWTFETFPEYLDAVAESGLRLNAAAMIGHSPLRLYVMGDAASEREATADEVAQMRQIVAEALDAGAIGFATSKSPGHAGADGKPVPSRLASMDEIYEIADALKDRGRGIFASTAGPGFYVDQMAELSERIGRPVTWTALVSRDSSPTAKETLDLQKTRGGEVWPQIACRPIVMQVQLSDPAPFAFTKAFTEILTVPHEARAALYRDEAWRARARADFNDNPLGRWDRVSVAETMKHEDLIDRPLNEVAAERSPR